MEDKTIDQVIKVGNLLKILYGFAAAIVMITAFFFLLQSDVKANTKDNLRQDKTIEILQLQQSKQSEKSEANQKEILDRLIEIKIQLERKQDRK